MKVRWPPLLLRALLLGLALMAAPAARIGALDLESVLARSAWTDGEKEQVRSVFAAADRELIPRELLLPRLAEGAAKRVSVSRLIDVLERSVRQLGRARALLVPLPGGQEQVGNTGSWQVTATLLETGAGNAEIRELCSAAGGRPEAFRAGGLLYASLVSWGASRTASLRVAAAAMRSPLSLDQFPGVVGIFEQARQKRISPDRLVGRLVESLPNARNIDDLRREILY